MNQDNQQVKNEASCQAEEYLQCAMEAADQGVRPTEIKEHCGCDGAKG